MEFRLEPISRCYGQDLEGGSIARFYIDQYIKKCISENDLTGKAIVEIGEDRYSSVSTHIA